VIGRISTLRNSQSIGVTPDIGHGSDSFCEAINTFCLHQI
jgi:hypothetical protein